MFSLVFSLRLNWSIHVRKHVSITLVFSLVFSSASVKARNRCQLLPFGRFSVWFSVEIAFKLELECLDLH